MRLSKWGFAYALGLLLLTIGVYIGALGNDFVDFDDNIYVTQNRFTQAGLTASGFRYALTTLDSGNWIPLTWLSYQLDTAIMGFRPWTYHATNLALHALNVLLIFFWLNQITGARGCSLIVAALFAVHPLHVESVAWIAERKDVLSTFWLLVALIAYERFCLKLSFGWYLATLIAFVLGLLSKSMVVTLPILMLILDFWPLNRMARLPSQQEQIHKYPVRSLRTLLIEKIPLLGLSLIDGLITITAQNAGHAVGEQSAGSALSRLPISIRLENAVVGYYWYLAKTFWPTGLCVYYPHPGEQLNTNHVLCAGVFLSLVVVSIVVFGRRRPHLIFGGLWYVVSLAPVIGIVQVGSQAYADRYSYVPQIGLLISIVWECQSWLKRIKAGQALGLVATFLAICAFSWMTVVQVAVWKSTETLWARVLVVDPDNWFAHLQVGNRRVLNGQADETAYRHLKIALDQSPSNPYALNNMGWILQNRGELDEATRFYRRAIKLNPKFSQAMHNLIVVLKKQGRLADEQSMIEDYIENSPDDAWAINELGMINVRQGQMEKARALFERSLKVDSGQRDAQVNLALTLSQLGNDQEAKTNLEAVLFRYPNDENSLVNLGLILERLGQLREARHQYAEALRWNPKDFEASERLKAIDKILSER